MDFKETELWKYLKTAGKPIVLYGMGNGADKIIKVLEENKISFEGVFSSDGFKKNKTFHGFEISSFEELQQKFGEMIVLLCFGSSRPEVLENVRKIAEKQEIYAPEVPVIGKGLFTEEYVNENLNAFETVYNRLADEVSKKTFENTVKFKLSGKIDYLFDCEVPIDEPYESFLKFNKNESFLDLGAYNGDTVTDFTYRVEAYQRIIAVEPDKKTFKKLLLNTQHLTDLECKNVCVSNICGTGAFGMRGGRNSGTENATVETEFMTVDGILKGDKISYIKMDIEGEEMRAIEGAQKTISLYKPKMLISCYHRTEDLITLPQAVLDIREDYKIYMRHFASLPAWDTNYYFV